MVNKWWLESITDDDYVCPLNIVFPQSEYPSSAQRYREWEIWDCVQLEVQESSFKLFIYENIAWDLGL